MKDKFSSILEPIAELLAKKRNDYGDNYEQGREKRGPVSFYLRIEDKLNRIEQLDSSPAQVKTETIEDTLNDIIGYCTLEINYRREKESSESTRLRCADGFCTNEEMVTSKDVTECKNAITISKGLNWFVSCPRRSGNDD